MPKTTLLGGPSNAADQPPAPPAAPAAPVAENAAADTPTAAPVEDQGTAPATTPARTRTAKTEE